MSKAIRIHELGGPEVMKWEEVEVGEPGPGQARVRHHAVGLNYLDVYYRTGLYKQPMPGVIGSEGAGLVEAIGAGVSVVRVGRSRRVCREPDRCLRRSAEHARRCAGQAARSGVVRAGRCDDAPRHDHRVSPQAHVQGEIG